MVTVSQWADGHLHYRLQPANDQAYSCIGPTSAIDAYDDIENIVFESAISIW